MNPYRTTPSVSAAMVRRNPPSMVRISQALAAHRRQAEARTTRTTPKA
jgi:hypothetical protein